MNTSPLVSTTVTDPLGNQTIYHFNPQGFLLDMTDALGEKTVYNLQNGTNLVASVVDPLGRTTVYQYDNNENMTSVTRLSGTSEAVTTSFTYDPTFNKTTSITDPLRQTTNYSYDKSGNLVTITNPAAEQTTFSYDNNGELTSSTDPMGNRTLLLSRQILQPPIWEIHKRRPGEVGRGYKLVFLCDGQPN